MLSRGSEAQKTATFVSMFDKFFDMINVSNFTNGTHYRKPFKHPYRSSDDTRLYVSANPCTCKLILYCYIPCPLLIVA